MRKVKILTDTTSDLTNSLGENILEKIDVDYVGLYVSFNEEIYQDWVEIKPTDLYKKVEEKKQLPKTSCASPQDYVDFFKKYVDEGYAKGIIDNMDVIDNAMAGIEAMSVNPQISSSTIANSSNQNDIIRLLEEIANKDFTVVLEGDMDRVFRVIQRKSEKNKQITGQEAFA